MEKWLRPTARGRPFMRMGNRQRLLDVNLRRRRVNLEPHMRTIHAFVFCNTLTAIAISCPHAEDAAARRDGQHDFDFEVGSWKTHVSRLLHPLTGSKTWVEYDGTTAVRKVWNGRAVMLELEMDGGGSHFEGLSLRMYNPESHQWSLNFANSSAGVMSTPTIGEFHNGRGEFYDQETLGARAILVRFVISNISHDSVHFEQAFSDDGGKTWEVNWLATDTRSTADDHSG
jgi:hypothetical protein